MKLKREIKKHLNNEDEFQIELFWSIDEGYTWLDETYSINLENYEIIIDEYIQKTEYESMSIKNNYFKNYYLDDFYLDFNLYKNKTLIEIDESDY
jgi:hypothetical protein